MENLKPLIHLFGVALFASCALLPQKAKAQCECVADADVQTQIDEADAIFRGNLMALSEDWDDRVGAKGWNFHVEVVAVYKGEEIARRVNIRSPSPRAEPCSIDLEREQDYLIYATAYNDYDEFTSSLCMGTKSFGEAGDDLLLLGRPRPPVEFSCASLPGAPVFFLGAPGLWIYLRRRRR